MRLIWSSSCFSSSMYWFIPPFGRSGTTCIWFKYSFYAQVCWPFGVLYLPLFGLVQQDRLHQCPIHPNWVDSSEALYDSTRFARYDSTRFARYVSTRFARSRVSQIDFRHDESTTGETIRVDSIESSRIDDPFKPPCIAHRKSRSVK